MDIRLLIRPQGRAGPWTQQCVFSHHLGPHPLFPLRSQDPLWGQPFVTQPHMTQRAVAAGA